MTGEATIGPAGPMIAQNEGPSQYAGAGLLDSGMNMWKDIGDGKTDWLSMSVDGLAVGLDVLAMAMNPLGELIKAGVGWVMEHVSWIREPLEMLTGDPGAITAVSKTWANIAQYVAGVADRYEQSLGGISGWAGEAAEKYRANAKDYINGLRALAGHSDDVGQGVAIAGMVVATVRAIVFDIIASFISRVITNAILAAASAAVTFGGSIAAFFTSLGVDATVTASRVAERMAKLLQSIRRFVQRFSVLGEKGATVAKKLNQRAQNIHNWSNRAVKSNGRLKWIRDMNFSRANSPLAKLTRPNGTIAQVNNALGDVPQAVAESPYSRATKESAKSYKDGQYEDGANKK
ncbi:hypothetical protein Afil01_10890 [Actinorhabdospora filicis]|uniref:PPE family protein n=1 Tax=Actinorhabdospora filicis TaxID=1785913 RepID=A0A9W6W1U5_9ACTN|nr:hypothetical protein [Actinorhabdospora filicis]GLZ76282.1 hypothetical protein Afil01_10890 [Actinorhabdospora filicis]